MPSISSVKNTNINEDQELPENLIDYITNIIKDEGYLSYDVEYKAITTNNNFLSILYEVNIKGEKADGEKILNLFVKHILKDDVSSVFDMSELFSKEAYFYKELSRILAELQEDAKIPLNERFNTIKSYSGDSTMIIMENGVKNGYKTLHSTEIGTWDYCKESMKNLAKLHALSFVLEKKKPQYFDAHIRTLKTPHKFTDEWRKATSNIFNLSVMGLESEDKRKIESILPILLNKIPDYLQDTTKRCCINHGDYRPNNILMKKIGGKLSLIPLDYQHMFYGSPVLDFCYFVAFTTDQTFRRAHLTDLKKVYYEGLEEFLKYFKMDVTKIYPKVEFDRDYDEMQDFILITSLVAIPLLYASDSDCDVGDYFNGSAKLDPKYKERIQQITDLIERFRI